jgi:hypothetical protein
MTPTATATATATATSTPTPVGTVPPTATPTPVLDCLGVPGGSAILDLCGVCNGNNSTCTGCTTVNIREAQIKLDSQAEAQLRLIKAARTQTFRATKNRARRTAVTKIVNTSSEIVLRMWQGIWTYPSNIFTCTNVAVCAATDITALAKSFATDSEQLVNLLDQAVRVLRNAKKNRSAGRVLVRSMALLEERNQLELARIPSTQSTCSN